MSERKRAIEAYLRQAHQATWPVLAAIPGEARERIVYSEGDGPWTVRDIVAHLADAEAGLLGQVQRLMAGKVTVPADFDLNRWNRSAVRRSQGRTFDELVGQIAVSHREAITTLETCDEAALDLQGRHSSGKVLTAEGFFRRMADHRQEHTRDIQRAISGAVSGKNGPG